MNRSGPALALLVALGACGTTYDVPEAGETSLAQARGLFAAERDPATAAGARLAPAAAAAQFQEVVARVEPVAEGFCRSQTAEVPNFNCDIRLLLDTEATDRNASQSYGPGGVPQVTFTRPLIADARNPDELAFVMGHEMGHHIGQHIQKGQQQAVAGMLILGALTAYGQAQATGANPYRSTYGDRQQMEDMMGLGAAIGDRAFSQTYELEADVIGTFIATAAGYDPVLGARFFARPESPTTPEGARSFWGTHPSDEARLATVIETVARIRAAQPAAE
jgi:Zn-dependent protease with chaperone function